MPECRGGSITTISLAEIAMDDIPGVALMNRALILDEGSRNTMTVPELEQRMKDFLSGEYRGVLIRYCGETAGYCVYRPEEDEHNGKRGIYLRQYYIKPEFRRHGLGRAALNRIISTCFQGASFVLLDVLECNSPGKAFWAATGFKPVYHRMKMEM